VERVSRSFAVEAGKKGLRMATVIEPSTPREVYGDETRFGQILRNIISNAVKFTNSGHIVVTLRPSGARMVTVLVEDTGPGVASEHRSLIFDDFSQIESPSTRKAGGVGLGLALVRRLVDAMGGSIDLEASPSGGSVFGVELPFSPVAQDSSDNAGSSPRIRSAATDDVLIARAWAPWCEAAGVALHSVPSTEFRASPAKYDLIITTEQHAPDIPDSEALLVVSGLHRKRGGGTSHLQYGTIAFEPVAVDVIRDMLYGGRPGVGENDAGENNDRENDAGGTPATEGSLELLVVDDDKSNLVFHRKLLESFGHHVVTAVGGSDALEALRKGEFDVAVLDIEMPDMDGWELADRIRSGEGGESGRNLPLLALSGHAAREISHRAAEVGFDGVLTKPVHVETLDRRIRSAAAGTQSRPWGRSSVSGIREAIERGNDEQAQQLLTAIRRSSPRTGVAETAFRLLLALRRKDGNTIQRLVAELEKETEEWDQNRTSAS
jgi:CheY-like chemotaxis protein